MYLDTYEMISGTLNIKSAVHPFCFTTPLTVSQSGRLCGSLTWSEGMKLETGVEVSNPLPRVHG
ncbi:hypothetical protein M5D96_002798 [Drosophila gunungcola]|uniref:Uncharacterized protein n=1 Tax=Drosophila gunungcola TaxID=103775 RepID=A0A9P9Z0P1_9MUSC|nr:hypothetical protein M5D96_002798 [Drosophila gunungcola]